MDYVKIISAMSAVFTILVAVTTLVCKYMKMRSYIQVETFMKDDSIAMKLSNKSGVELHNIKVSILEEIVLDSEIKEFDYDKKFKCLLMDGLRLLNGSGEEDCRVGVYSLLPELIELEVCFEVLLLCVRIKIKKKMYLDIKKHKGDLLEPSIFFL